MAVGDEAAILIIVTTRGAGIITASLKPTATTTIGNALTRH